MSFSHWKWINMLGFKIGDSVKYHNLNIAGKITDRDVMTGLWVINNTILASEEDLTLDTDVYFIPDKPKRACTCGSQAVGSDRHSQWCDSNE